MSVTHKTRDGCEASSLVLLSKVKVLGLRLVIPEMDIFGVLVVLQCVLKCNI